MDNLDDLIGQLHRMAYIPQPVLRVYIPKAGSKKMRPLGIPALNEEPVKTGLIAAHQHCIDGDFTKTYHFRFRKNHS